MSLESLPQPLLHTILTFALADSGLSRQTLLFDLGSTIGRATRTLLYKNGSLFVLVVCACSLRTMPGQLSYMTSSELNPYIPFSGPPLTGV